MKSPDNISVFFPFHTFSHQVSPTMCRQYLVQFRLFCRWSLLTGFHFSHVQCIDRYLCGIFLDNISTCEPVIGYYNDKVERHSVAVPDCDASRYVGGDDMIGALHIVQLQLSLHTISVILSSNKIRNGRHSGTGLPGFSWKMVVEQVSCLRYPSRLFETCSKWFCCQLLLILVPLGLIVCLLQ